MNWYEAYLHMKAGTALDEAHLRELNAVLEQYPFFALGRMMVAKVATKLNDPRAQQLRFLGALYAPSRQHYAFFLEERMRPRVSPPPRVSTAARETQTPPARTEKKEEPTSSGEEPGPAAMPYSEAFSPPLQGWIAARQALYGALARRLRAQLAAYLVEHMPREPSPSDAPPEKPSQQIAEQPPAPSTSQSQPPVPSYEVPTPSEAPLPSAHAPVASQPTGEILPSTEEKPVESTPIPAPSTQPPAATPAAGTVVSPEQPSESKLIQPVSAAPLQPTDIRHNVTFSPIGIATILQLELSSSPRRRQDTAPGGPYSEALTASSLPAPAPEVSASVPPESPSEPPTLVAEPPEPATPSILHADDLREQFHRAYVPLDSPEAPIRSFTPPAPETTATESEQHAPANTLAESPAELQKQFHREYIPLEGVDREIHLSASDDEAPTPVATSPTIWFASDSPIRSFVPLQIDLEASIHLPIPEPEELPAPIAPSEGATASPQTTETTPTESTIIRGWHSFLEEIQKELPLTEAPPSPVAQELEDLRREFIRRLLAQRPAHSPPASVSAEENMIDLLIRKIEAFHPQTTPAVEREVPDLTIPGWETPAAAPKVYTETMARLYWSQGDAVRAIQVYEGLIQKHPENAEYYRQQIARIRSGEMP